MAAEKGKKIVSTSEAQTLILKEIYESIKKTIPQGEVASLSSIEITTEYYEVTGPQFPPLFGFSIHNYGPDAVWVCINSKLKKRKINIDDDWALNMGAGVIKRLYLVCEPGENATVDVDITY